MKCSDCQNEIRHHLYYFNRPTKCARNDCNNQMCKDCMGKNPLIVDDVVKCFCKICFRELSTIDFEKNYEIVQGKSNFVFVFVHGGGGNRKMFYKHAELLCEKYNHTSILLDLPGHGSLVDRPLSLNSAMETVESVIQSNDMSKKSVIYVGGSLGAYIGFYILHRLMTSFKGAILLDCGQNVGPSASLKARLGLTFLNLVGSCCSNAQMMNLMKKVASKSTADFYINETSFASGMFFQQGERQVECLKSVAPETLIPTIDIPILFMNGSKDYRDSENKWLDLCVRKDLSSLKVYEGGDHFFTHDKRFVDDIVERWDSFAKIIKP